MGRLRTTSNNYSDRSQYYVNASRKAINIGVFTGRIHEDFQQRKLTNWLESHLGSLTFRGDVRALQIHTSQTIKVKGATFGIFISKTNAKKSNVVIEMF